MGGSGCEYGTIKPCLSDIVVFRPFVHVAVSICEPLMFSFGLLMLVISALRCKLTKRGRVECCKFDGF